MLEHACMHGMLNLHVIKTMVLRGSTSVVHAASVSPLLDNSLPFRGGRSWTGKEVLLAAASYGRTYVRISVKLAA